MAELDDVLRQAKFKPYLSDEDRLDFLASLIRDATVVDVALVLAECRDPKDNKFLELAIDGKATQIVIGDNDLLVLHPFRGTAIVTPRTFLAMTEAHG